MERIKKTAYEWCLEASIRPLKLSQWETEMPFYEEAFYTEKIDVETFYDRIANCDVKPNSQPRKTEMYLEYRMYGLVNYQLSGTIHAGIQYGHAVVEFGQSIKGMGLAEKLYDKWADKDKTFIILNGGTTNTNPERYGSLNLHYHNLLATGIQVQSFYEPDLGDQLTAVVFLVDERVFNRELYPDFIAETLPWTGRKHTEKQLSELEAKNKKNYELWVEKIGGQNNAWLRDFLKQFRLA